MSKRGRERGERERKIRAPVPPLVKGLHRTVVKKQTSAPHRWGETKKPGAPRRWGETKESGAPVRAAEEKQKRTGSARQ